MRCEQTTQMEKIICEQRKNRNGNVPNALVWLHILVTFHTHYMCCSDFNVEVLNVWNESSLLIHLEPILWCECKCILLWLSHSLPNDDDDFSFKSICQCIMEPYEWCTQPKTYTVCKISMLIIDRSKAISNVSLMMMMNFIFSLSLTIDKSPECNAIMFQSIYTQRRKHFLIFSLLTSLSNRDWCQNQIY